EYPTCGGTCPEGLRCQSFAAFFGDVAFFAGCACVDPTGGRCELGAECSLGVVPFTHCADPSKACVVDLGGCRDGPTQTSARCEAAPAVVITTTTTTTSTTTSTSTTTTSTTTTTVPCASTPGVSGCFQDLGDCTILDTCTGLQWEKKSDDIPGGVHDVTARY